MGMARTGHSVPLRSPLFVLLLFEGLCNLRPDILGAINPQPNVGQFRRGPGIRPSATPGRLAAKSVIVTSPDEIAR
jgi:hypothetical protein